MPTIYIQTPIGIAKIVGDSNGISELKVLDDEVNISTEIPNELIGAVSQFKDYFEGKRTDFSIKTNVKGTVFQQKVWQELSKIPYGKTISYLDMAKKLGDPKTIRAAASANAKNPLWILVPCHRVIGSKGCLTGYAGGLWRKQWLLQHESTSKQQTLF